MTKKQLLALWITAGAVVSLYVTVQSFRDPDVWWHLALGKVIVAHGIPAQEPFSFTAVTRRWIDQQWLYEALLARLIAVGGPALASIFMGGIAALALGLAAFAVPLDSDIPGPWRATMVVLAAAVGGTVLGVRGQVMTVLGVAVVIFVLARWRERAGTWTVWLLPPVLLLWCNLHAGFVVGLVLPLVVGILPGASRRARCRLLAATAVAALATMVNPAGPALYPYVFETFANPTLTQHIVEWLSPNFHDPFMRLLEATVIGLIVAWTVVGKVDSRDAVPAGGALVATLQAQRNMALLAVILLPQLTSYGWAAWKHLRPRRGPTRPSDPYADPYKAWATGIVLLVTIGVLCARLPLILPSPASTEAALFPARAATYASIHLTGQRLYTEYEWGGYLAYRFPRERVVYIYGESAFFGDAQLQRYLDVHLLRASWVNVLRSDGMTHAVVAEDSQEASALLEIGWQIDCHDMTSRSLVLSAPSTIATGHSVLDDITSARAC